jgi:hypothetical protein
MWKFRQFAGTVVAASLVALAGCNTNNTAPAPVTTPQGPQASAPPVRVINTMCPIGGDEFGSEPRPASLSRQWQGKPIGFCCRNCVSKFDKMTEAKKTEVLTRAQANAAPE